MGSDEYASDQFPLLFNRCTLSSFLAFSSRFSHTTPSSLSSSFNVNQWGKPHSSLDLSPSYTAVEHGCTTYIRSVPIWAGRSGCHNSQHAEYNLTVLTQFFHYSDSTESDNTKTTGCSLVVHLSISLANWLTNLPDPYHRNLGHLLCLSSVNILSFHIATSFVGLHVASSTL